MTVDPKKKTLFHDSKLSLTKSIIFSHLYPRSVAPRKATSSAKCNVHVLQFIEICILTWVNQPYTISHPLFNTIWAWRCCMAHLHNLLFWILSSVYDFFTNTSFWKSALFSTSDIEAPNLVGPLEQAIFSLWANTEEHSTCEDMCLRTNQVHY